jgi:hypothetical protein
MPSFRNLNGLGAVVELGQGNGALSTTSNTNFSRSGHIRVGGAGNLIYRNSPNGADQTIPVSAGEYIPVTPGMIVLSTSTATGMHFIGD